MHQLLRVFLAVCIITIGFVRSSSEDWPEFRGPTAQGHVQGKLPIKWSETENVAWSVNLPGEGWSSPVIVAGRIYLTAGVSDKTSEPEKVEEAGKEAAPAKRKPKKNYSLRTLCLDAESGKTIWDVEVFQEPATAPNIHNKNSHASPTPIVKDGKIYVHFGHEGTACLDLEGKVLWKNTEYQYKPVHGNGGSPCLTQDTLIFCVDGTDIQAVVGLDINTGKTRWKTDRKVETSKHFSFGTPLVISVHGKEQVISVGSDVVMSIDPYTGKEIWRCRFKGYSQIPRPLFAHGLVYVCTGYESPKLLAIKPDGTGDITDTHLAWKEIRAVPNTPSPIIIGNELYMVNDFSVLSCLDAKTGERRWVGRLSGGHSASLIAADNKIYSMNEKGTCFVVEANPKEYKELSKNTLPGHTLATPSPYGGKLYIRTDEKLYCIK